MEETLQIPVPTTLDEHPCLQLDRTCRICRRCKFQGWWRSADNLSDSRKKCFSLAICLCYKAKEIYLHVEPPTVRYLTVKYRTRAKRQLQGDSFLSNVVVFCRKDESWGYPSFGQEISEKKNSVLFSLRK